MRYALVFLVVLACSGMSLAQAEVTPGWWRCPDAKLSLAIREASCRLKRAREVDRCDAGQAEGCLQLADLYFAGAAGIPQDKAKADRAHERALRLFTRDCDAGDKKACDRKRWTEYKRRLPLPPPRVYREPGTSQPAPTGGGSRSRTASKPRPSSEALDLVIAPSGPPKSRRRQTSSGAYQWPRPAPKPTRHARTISEACARRIYACAGNTPQCRKQTDLCRSDDGRAVLAAVALARSIDIERCYRPPSQNFSRYLQEQNRRVRAVEVCPALRKAGQAKARLTQSRSLAGTHEGYLAFAYLSALVGGDRKDLCLFGVDVPNELAVFNSCLGFHLKRIGLPHHGKHYVGVGRRLHEQFVPEQSRVSWKDAMGVFERRMNAHLEGMREQGRSTNRARSKALNTSARRKAARDQAAWDKARTQQWGTR